MIKNSLKPKNLKLRYNLLVWTDKQIETSYWVLCSLHYKRGKKNDETTIINRLNSVFRFLAKFIIFLDLATNINLQGDFIDE